MYGWIGAERKFAYEGCQLDIRGFGDSKKNCSINRLYKRKGDIVILQETENESGNSLCADVQGVRRKGWAFVPAMGLSGGSLFYGGSESFN